MRQEQRMIAQSERYINNQQKVSHNLSHKKQLSDTPLAKSTFLSFFIHPSLFIKKLSGCKKAVFCWLLAQMSLLLQQASFIVITCALLCLTHTHAARVNLDFRIARRCLVVCRFTLPLLLLPPRRRCITFFVCTVKNSTDLNGAHHYLCGIFTENSSPGGDMSFEGITSFLTVRGSLAAVLSLSPLLHQPHYTCSPRH